MGADGMVEDVMAEARMLWSRSRLEVPHGSGAHPCETQDGATPLALGGVRARVDRINVEGLRRTKDDLVRTCVQELFGATDFADLVHKAHLAKLKLDTLKCFRKDIRVHIDVSDGPHATPDGFEVTYKVKELCGMIGHVTGNITENESNLQMGLAFPNMKGGTETMAGTCTIGSKMSKFFDFNLGKVLSISKRLSSSLGFFYEERNHPESGYGLGDRGFKLELKKNQGREWVEKFQWVVNWRQLGIGDNPASTTRVLMDSGDSLRSVLRYEAEMDKLDCHILPNCGHFFKWSSEVAGIIGGSVGYCKHELDYKKVWSKWARQLVYQLTARCGLMHDMSNDKPPLVCDNFFLGGPTSLRGFRSRGVGPQIDGKFTGGSYYWSTGFSLFTPFPFNPGNGPGRHFRLHVFANAGNTDQSSKEPATPVPLSEAPKKVAKGVIGFLENQKAAVRLSTGFGIALKLGQMARVEFNWVWPLWRAEPDSALKGFQFGAGLDFL